MPRRRTVLESPILFANGWSCSDAYWVDLVPPSSSRRPPVRAARHPWPRRCPACPADPGRGARNLHRRRRRIPRIAADLLAVLDDAGIDARRGRRPLDGRADRRSRPTASSRERGCWPRADRRHRTRTRSRRFYGTSPRRPRLPGVASGGHALDPRDASRPVWATIGPAAGRPLRRPAGPRGRPEGDARRAAPLPAAPAHADPPVMLMAAAGMRANSAADLLPTIEVPTLVVAAGADVFTPVRCSEAMHRAIADSELIVHPEGDHTLPIEEPGPSPRPSATSSAATTRSPQAREDRRRRRRPRRPPTATATTDAASTTSPADHATKSGRARRCRRRSSRRPRRRRRSRADGRLRSDRRRRPPRRRRSARAGRRAGTTGRADGTAPSDDNG